MIKIASLPTIAGALLAFGLSAAPAAALANRTFVSGKGTDAGACAFGAPCRTFAFALTQTTAGGEIDVLDPAGYGVVTITKAISIVNDGAGVTTIGASSGNAITINAGANNSVHLRGLTIEGLGTGTNGILFTTDGNLEIENCVIRNFAFGINFSPNTSSTFSVSDTIASNNGNTGILVNSFGSAVVTGVLSKVTANNNNGMAGIDVDGSSTTGASLNVTIVDSVASNNGNGGAGVFARNAATAVMLRNVVASNNSVGLFAITAATLRVAHSVVTGNSVGVSTSTAVTVSYGDNDIDGNTNNITGVLTPLAMH
jgi:hypothetical protein